jgi:hypothetical protein
MKATDQNDESKIAALKSAIAKGIVSGEAKSGVFARIRNKYGLLDRTARTFPEISVDARDDRSNQ